MCAATFRHVSYAEIDWEAYMQEVDMWQAGERDYVKIHGSTGPLVCTARFLYLFGALKILTKDGTDIRQAQRIFLLFYLFNMAIVLSI